MFKIDNIEITDSSWLDLATSIIKEVLDCQDWEDFENLDNMILNEETMNEEYIKGKGSLLENLKKDGEFEVDYETPGGFGWIRFNIIVEE